MGGCYVRGGSFGLEKWLVMFFFGWDLVWCGLGVLMWVDSVVFGDRFERSLLVFVLCVWCVDVGFLVLNLSFDYV